MSYSYPEIRQLRGRYVQRNSFEVPDGALEIGHNVTVQSDFVLSKRRGFYQYFAPGSGTLKQLAKYENKLIAIFGTKISYFTDTGTAPNETGTETVLTNETALSWTANSLTPRTMQASENLYVTTDAGAIKLTAYNSQVQAVGSPSGQDISAQFYPKLPSEWFLGDKVVGYRAVFGRIDANDMTVLGAPGDVATITNPKIDASYTSAGAGPWTVTVTSTNHGRLTGEQIRVEGATNANANGVYTITVTGASTFQYTVTVADPVSGTLDYSMAQAVLVSMSVPEECASTAQGWFVQLYRSGQYDIAGDVFSDYKLVTQRTLTAAEISANILFFTDTTEDVLRGLDLYTNENTGEGEFQANARPPKAEDLALFKDYAFYANCTIRPTLELSVVDPSVMAAGDILTVRIIEGVTTTEEAYVAREGVANSLAYSDSIAGVGPFTVTYAGHGFSNGDVLYISNVIGGSYANQQATASGVTGSTFDVTLTGSGVPTSLWFEGVTNGTNPIFKLNKTSASFAVQLQETAVGIVKAISRRSAGKCYGRYLSDFSEVPGQIAILGRGFYDSIAVKASSSVFGAGFEPILPTSYGTVISKGTREQANLYISKVGEPEAVPLIQFLRVGSENQAILRIAALRDSLIIAKEDGLFRLSGDNPNNFVVTILDSTVILGWPDSLAIINNQVAMLANVGVCLTSETAVSIISRKIEEDIRPILGRASNLAHGIAYESERLYLLTATRPNDSALSICHVYNTLTDEWTTWDKLFMSGVVGPDDTLYQIDLDNKILIERKSQTRIDYSDQNYPTIITAVSGKVVTFTVPSGIIPEKGDMLVIDTALNRLATDPSLVAANTYQATLEIDTTLIIGDTPILYGRIASQIVTAPFHAGLVGRMKQFAQVQLHFRSDQASRLTLFFIGDALLGSTEVEWTGVWRRAGFGYFPFGFDYFGQSYGLDLPVGTGPSPICRIYVPIQQQRSTYIQASITHTEAGEAINLQAISWALRSYGERVTK
jgi:hypothetical protein